MFDLFASPHDPALPSGAGFGCSDNQLECLCRAPPTSLLLASSAILHSTAPISVLDIQLPAFSTFPR